MRRYADSRSNIIGLLITGANGWLAYVGLGSNAGSPVRRVRHPRERAASSTFATEFVRTELRLHLLDIWKGLQSSLPSKMVHFLA